VLTLFSLDISEKVDDLLFCFLTKCLDVSIFIKHLIFNLIFFLPERLPPGTK